MVLRNSQILFAGSARELPNTRRAGAGFGGVVEAGFDSGKRYQIGRQTLIDEDTLHRSPVVAAAQQARFILFAQAFLNAKI